MQRASNIELISILMPLVHYMYKDEDIIYRDS